MSILVLLFALTSFACSSLHTSSISIDTQKKDPYQITISTEKLDSNTYKLIASIELQEGSWFVSPYSKDDYKGHWRVNVPVNDKLMMDNKFSEIPRAELQENTFRQELAYFVTKNTSYHYKLKVMTEENFELTGMIMFVIEPQCTMEKLTFQINQSAGELSVTQPE